MEPPGGDRARGGLFLTGLVPYVEGVGTRPGQAPWSPHTRLASRSEVPAGVLAGSGLSAPDQDLSKRPCLTNHPGLAPLSSNRKQTETPPPTPAHTSAAPPRAECEQLPAQGLLRPGVCHLQAPLRTQLTRSPDPLGVRCPAPWAAPRGREWPHLQPFHRAGLPPRPALTGLLRTRQSALRSALMRSGHPGHLPFLDHPGREPGPHLQGVVLCGAAPPRVRAVTSKVPTSAEGRRRPVAFPGCCLPRHSSKHPAPV